MERPGGEWRTYTGCQDSCPGQGSKIKQHLDYSTDISTFKKIVIKANIVIFFWHFDHLKKFSLLMKYKCNYICDIHLFNIMTSF